MPGAANGSQKFVGSVVGVQNDRTTLKVAFEEGTMATEYNSQLPETMVVGGTTFVAYTASDINPDSDFTMTVGYECSRADGKAVPTCTIDTFGHGPDTTILPGNSENPATTTTFSGDMQHFMNNFQIALTAGTEKLSASPAATTTVSAKSTAAQSSGAPASGAQTSGASATSGAASTGGAQSTGAAAPMRSMAPVLAGLGAAAAFFV